MTDQELLQLVIDGNEEAFTQIYQKYWKSLFKSAYDRLKDKKQSQDVVQDVFVSLWERRHHLIIDHLNAYLHTSVRYNVLKLVASNKITVDYFDVLENLNLQSQSADTRIVSNELWEAYQDILKNMPPQRKKIFQMRFEDNMKTRDIAETLNISQKTVQNQLLSSSAKVRSLVTQVIVIAFLLFRN